MTERKGRYRQDGTWTTQPERKFYACEYGLGCEGQACKHEDCPRKAATSSEMGRDGQ